MDPVIPVLIEHVTEALGEPVCTPEWSTTPDGRERAKYRVFRWDCPVCHAGLTDPDGIYRPFTIDSDGNVFCLAKRCPDKHLFAAVNLLRDAKRVADTKLEAAA